MSKDAPLLRMFCPDFKGKVEVLACEDGEEGFNYTICDNFRLPERDVMEAVLPQGKGDLGALGDPDATGVPKQHVEKHGDKRLRRPKKLHEPVVVPPLVPEFAGISRVRLHKYNDYVVESDTLEGLGVLGSGAAAGGSSAGSRPADDKKRKGDAHAAGGQKGPKLRRTRGVAISKPTHAVTTGKLKEDRRSPSIERVSPPPVHVEDTAKKSAGVSIVDTLDSSNNLIYPNDPEVQGGEKLKSPITEKPKSPVAKKVSGSTTVGTGFEDQPSIQPGEPELEFYYRSYMVDWGLDYHRPPWTVMQGDDVSNDPSACRDILSGLGTPFEVLRARGLPHENRINQLSSMLVLGRKEEETIRLRAEAEALVKAAREGAEQLEKYKAAFVKLKQTESWAATAGLKQVRTLAKLLSDERKGWREACARENEKLFRVCQELNNLKATNAVLLKEKAVAEAAAKEAKEAEARGAKALEEADADRSKLNKAVEELQANVQSRAAILEEVTARVTEVEMRARQAEEARDGLTTSLNQVKADRDWMCDHDIGHIVGTILDAPESATVVNELKECTRRAGFNAGYNECIAHVNPFYQSRFTDERSGFHGIDTEGLYAAAVDAYNNLSLSAIEDSEKCLEAEDYMDRLQLLYERPEEEEAAGGAKKDAGTSGTKED
ncbi:hypothetical protein Hanom_Chr03g00180321 [Helianthus anomalus]